MLRVGELSYSLLFIGMSSFTFIRLTYPSNCPLNNYSCSHYLRLYLSAQLSILSSILLERHLERFNHHKYSFYLTFHHLIVITSDALSDSHSLSIF